MNLPAWMTKDRCRAPHQSIDVYVNLSSANRVPFHRSLPFNPCTQRCATVTFLEVYSRDFDMHYRHYTDAELRYKSLVQLEQRIGET